MKKITTIGFSLLLSMTGWYTLYGQSTLSLTESTGQCGMVTNCMENIVCFDILLTPAVDAEALSYNIWLKYPNSGLSYVADSACITEDGIDNDLNVQGYYRVAGVLGDAMVEAGVTVSLHTVCFSYESTDSISGNTISVGGTLFNVLHSPMTYNNPFSNEPMLPDFPFVMNEDEVSCLILPVTWLSFEVQKKGEASNLQWITAQEFNNAGFQIERSADGRHFQKIGSMPATEVPQLTNPYSFTDLTPLPGMNYYRIMQIDRDGTTSYSEIRSVNFYKDDFEVRLWPNPARHDLHIDLPAFNSGGEIQLVHPGGQTILSQSFDENDKDASLSLSNVDAGLYTVVVRSSENTFIEKIVILR
jgi:hypothetical protein